MKTIAVIGTGKMGAHMARNLMARGFAVTAYDPSADRLDEVVRAGAVRAASEADAVSGADIAVLSLPSEPVLEAVIGKLADTDLTGKIVIDTTTATMDTAARLAERVARRGGAMLDAPVTGGTAGAETGRLSFFVGGDPSAHERCLDVFAAMGDSYVLVGPSGHGQVGKMVCQMIGSVSMCITAEAMGLAAKLDADIRKIAEAFGEHCPPMLAQMIALAGESELGDQGYTAQRSKDIDYCVIEAARHQCYIPVTHAMNQVYTMARLQGLGDTFPTALFKVWEKVLEKPLVGNGTNGSA